MRFPRNATIFRGQLDVAAFAGLFFLLALFLLLSSLVYTPGVAIDLTPSDELATASIERKTVIVARSGQISYEEKTYDLTDLERLRNELKKLPGQSVLVVRADPSTPREIIVRLREMARDLKILFQAPGFPIELPPGGNLPGTTKRTFTIAVNLGGQIFHDNQWVQENVLRARLIAAVRQSSEPLALVVLADKDTTEEVLVRLRLLAEEAQVKEMLLGTQPRAFPQPKGKVFPK